MKVLVTGGSGFIGSHVVDALVEGGHQVVVVDRQPSPHENPAATYRHADITDPSTWAGLLEGIEAVSHQAARVGLGTRFAEVADYVTDNDLGTATMLRAMADAGFTGRLVLAGSMVVYGEGAYHCPTCGPRRAGARHPERLAAGRFEPACPTCGGDLTPTTVGEEAPIDPRNVYAATKAHQEQLCAVFARETGASVISLRYHNVYGPRAPLDTPYSGVASIFLSSLRRGEAPQVFEDGGQQRDFVHVTDVARANMAALTAPAAGDSFSSSAGGSFDVCNVASGGVTTVLGIATGLWEALGRPGPAPTVTGAWRLGDVRHVVASPAWAMQRLGFRAEVALEDGLAELAHLPVPG